MKCNAHEGVYEQGKEAGEIIGIKIGEEKGLKIGEEKGIKIGEEKGIKIGEKIKSHEIAKKLLLLGASIEIIVKSTGLSLGEITEINKEYKCEKSS